MSESDPRPERGEEHSGLRGEAVWGSEGGVWHTWGQRAASTAGAWGAGQVVGREIRPNPTGPQTSCEGSRMFIQRAKGREGAWLDAVVRGEGLWNPLRLLGTECARIGSKERSVRRPSQSSGWQDEGLDQGGGGGESEWRGEKRARQAPGSRVGQEPEGSLAGGYAVSA